MKNLLKQLSFALAALCLTVTGFAETEDGGYAGAFFQVPIGARPTSLGGAYLGVSDDGAGPLYNPAGPADLSRPLFSSAYRAMQLDRQLAWASILVPVRGNSALGLSWLYGGSGTVEGRNYDGDLTGNDFAMNNHAFSILFAKRFESFLLLGIKLDYLHSSFASLTAYSVGIDFGAMIQVEKALGREKEGSLPVKDLQIGVTVKHIDASYLWNNEAYVQEFVDGDTPPSEQIDEVPMEFGIGVSGRLMDRKLLLATDFCKNAEQGACLHAGAEYLLNEQLALRGGFSDGRLTAGTGYSFTIGKQILRIDYAFSTEREDVGSEHIFSFDLLF